MCSCSLLIQVFFFFCQKAEDILKTKKFYIETIVIILFLLQNHHLTKTKNSIIRKARIMKVYCIQDFSMHDYSGDAQRNLGRQHKEKSNKRYWSLYHHVTHSKGIQFGCEFSVNMECKQSTNSSRRKSLGPNKLLALVVKMECFTLFLIVSPFSFSYRESLLGINSIHTLAYIEWALLLF